MTVLVFDLDDTLYDEKTFVFSGFRAVCDYLEKNFDIPKKESYPLMVEDLNENGRGHIFDNTLKKFNIYSKSIVEKCVTIYRTHQPTITIDPEADKCLTRFSKFPKYIVTDGNKMVQYNKLKALELFNRVKFCFITHRYGIKHAKPSPYCFNKICHIENVKPDQVVYVGDNPNKDFIGIKPLGFKTIRLKKGNYADINLSPAHEANYAIHSLNELTEALIKKLGCM
ncbi:HAD family hydrolase [Metabacillus arenae]|uniref:HAD-IA family hydrolase n=1 Tax=Metabacillus arenae TaxID=2771434 RepID=A0A926NPZ3_9BACI|nr:HAD-IA family hydrolase [Metabacillus arenae]MBD1381927.1 HAD-IA family hydrolase [Metabacillus arenae]